MPLFVCHQLEEGKSDNRCVADTAIVSQQLGVVIGVMTTSSLSQREFGWGLGCDGKGSMIQDDTGDQIFPW